MIETLIGSRVGWRRSVRPCAACSRCAELVLNADGEAQTDACVDLATLQRWLDQTVLAASIDEALQ